jgi:hypothetical protein
MLVLFIFTVAKNSKVKLSLGRQNVYNTLMKRPIRNRNELNLKTPMVNYVQYKIVLFRFQKKNGCF